MPPSLRSMPLRGAEGDVAMQKVNIINIHSKLINFIFADFGKC